MPEFEQAFTSTKSYIIEPSIFSSLEAAEELYMYLVVSKTTISVILLRMDEEKQYKPMYYVSKALVGTEVWYTHIQQTTFALRVVAKKLHPYFQAHLIIVLMNLLLQVTLHKANLSKWMIKWVVELSEYGIQYKPRLSLKG